MKESAASPALAHMVIRKTTICRTESAHSAWTPSIAYDGTTRLDSGSFSTTLEGGERHICHSFLLPLREFQEGRRSGTLVSPPSSCGRCVALSRPSD